ncbi:MAG: phosphotransferase [Candidatus Eisenbacteria bacterium]
MSQREPELLRFLEKSLSLLQGSASPSPDLDRLAGDGSTRRIYRIRGGGVPAVLVLNPLPAGRAHPDENEAFLAVRQFLDRRGVRVPRFFAADIERGYLLLEDLGDERLFDLIRRDGWPAPDGESSATRLYQQAIVLLIAMQVRREPFFHSAWTSNPAYTEEFILEMEAAYFHREFVERESLEQNRPRTAPAGSPPRGPGGSCDGEPGRRFRDVEPECRSLARTALACPERPFMHRDFQSRNLMVCGGSLVVIDFQGARHGPAEYDLAALLYDPYAAMPGWVRERMIAYYLDAAAVAGVPGLPTGRSDVELRAWRRRLLANAADRMMQALGAYGKLGLRLGRPGFREHIPQALAGLDGILDELDCCPRLHALVRSLRAAGGDA